jgi:DNA-binding beta-propeller fold protein YncE
VGEVFQYDVGAGGTLTAKNPPTVSTGDVAGIEPSEVAVSPDGRSVYVTASSGALGDPAYQSYVMQYDVGADGTLSPKSPAMVVAPFRVFCSTPGDPTSCSGADFSAGGVAVTPDGKSVYVAGYLSAPYALSHPGYVLQYDVGAGGTLSPKSPATVRAGGETAGVAVSPDGASVYVANNGGMVSQYDVGAGGTLSPKSPATVFEDVGALGGVAVSPDGASVYITSSYSVLQYDAGAGGALSPKSPPTVPAGRYPPGAVVVSPNGKSVYVTDSRSDSVLEYDVGAGGTLSPKSPPTVAAGDGPHGIAVSPPRVPTHKEQCKGGGWRSFPQFRNQGNCISFVQTHR